ncbi:MAG: hypothetical protein LBG60_14130 [Bifidobacteriaceae bacterium]|nr:hypothetical protein [Bifidobacteriaceae bacterium]
MAPRLRAAARFGEADERDSGHRRERKRRHQRVGAALVAKTAASAGRRGVRRCKALAMLVGWI